MIVEQHTSRRPPWRFAWLPALAILAASATAQRTWVVDQAGRPGADFTDLPPAVAAAGPGDTIFVRARNAVPYSSATTSKGLVILGEDLGTLGLPLLTSLEFQDVPQGQRAVLANLLIDDSLRITRAQGSVFLDQVGNIHPFGSWSFTDVALFSLHRCTCIGPPLAATRSEGVVESYTAEPYLWQDAITLDHSRLVLTNASVLGGQGLWGTGCQIQIPARQAIAARDSRITLAHLAAVLRGGGYAGCLIPNEPALAMNGGVLERDAGSQVAGITPGSVFREVVGPLVSLVTNLDTATRQVQATVRGGPGLMTLTVVGRPFREPIDTPFGVLWLDATTLVVADVGALAGDGRRTWGLVLPPGGRPGALLAAQSVAIEGTSARLSTPSFLVDR